MTKYEHRFSEAYNLGRREVAVLCVLLLRGPQTPGELRGRTERLHNFEELSDVQSTLQKLIERDPPLVKVLHRRPGTKESRYMHLFCGDSFMPLTSPEPDTSRGATGAENDARMLQLEEQVAELKREVAELRALVRSRTD